MSEYQGNDETAALEDEEAAMPMPDRADQPSAGSMEDDESTWDDD